MEETTIHEHDRTDQLAAALAKAQSQISHAEKGRDNPHFGHGYATLADIWDACRKPLTDNGLSVVQMPQGGEDGWACLETRLMHSSGQSVASVMRIPVVKRDPQAFGSAITYARRYALAAIAGVAPDDDDGNAAAGKTQGQSQQRGQQQRQPAPESRGDAAAAKSNGNGTADWKTRCVAKLRQLFPSAEGAAAVQMAIASAVLGKPVETFEGWEDNRHWRAYLERLEKLTKADVNKIISDAFVTVTSEPEATGALPLDDPFDPNHPAQQEAPAMTRGA